MYSLATGIDDGTVYSLTLAETTLYAGGSFSTIGGVTAVLFL